MMQTRYFLLMNAGQTPCSMDKGQYWQARGTWLCNGCGAPKPGTEKIDVILQNSELGPVPLNMISGTGLGVGRRSFFEELGWREVSRDLWLGAVHRGDGKPFEDWVSYHGRHPIIVRGKELASYRVCRECSRVVYFAKDDSYLCPPPPSSADVFDAGNSLLVASDRLFDLSSVRPVWHGLKVSELPVLETPLDGFDEIVSPYLASGNSKGR